MSALPQALDMVGRSWNPGLRARPLPPLKPRLTERGLTLSTMSRAAKQLNLPSKEREQLVFHSLVAAVAARPGHQLTVELRIQN